MDKDILDIIKENQKDEYKGIVEKKGELKILNALSNIRRNILNWYPFKFDSTLLEINTNYGEITEELCEKVRKVITIENSYEKVNAIEKRLKNENNLEIISKDLSEIDFKENFDYIVINGVEERNYTLLQYLDFAKKYLKEDGIILFTCDNMFGLKTFNINMQIEDTKKYLSREYIENIIKEVGFENYKFYYPLPNYKTPNVIFTDTHLPTTETIERDFTLYDKDDILLFDERYKYKQILNENRELFKFFANSFLVEIFKEDNGIKFISYNNSRKDKYKLKTILTKDVAYKKYVYQNGKEHFENIKLNINKLNDLKFNILDTYDKDKICSKLIDEEKLLDKILINKFNEGKHDEVYELIDKYIFELKEKLYDGKTKIIKNIFEKFNIEVEKELNDKMHFVKYGFFDLIFQNCFYLDNKFYFFDQEWIEEGVPIEFILYRAIEYLANTSKSINKNEFFEKFNLTEYIELFLKIENLLQEQIKDEFMWRMHALNKNTVKDLYETQVHYRNLNAILQQEKLEDKNINEQEIKQKEKEIQIKETEIKQNEKKIDELTKEIQLIKNSRSWKIIGTLRKIIGKKRK